jgi:hypothetical protein
MSSTQKTAICCLDQETGSQVYQPAKGKSTLIFRMPYRVKTIQEHLPLTTTKVETQVMRYSFSVKE